LAYACTEVLKEVLDLQKRGGDLFAIDETKEGNGKIESEEEIGLLPKEKVARRERQEQRAFERNKKYFGRISDMSNDLPKEKLALSQMRGAVEQGDFNSWRNAISDMLGYEVLKTASAQTVNSASKQFLMSSLASLTGRPNQFIEKQITKGLISPKYKDIANQLILEGYEGLSDLKEKEIQIAQQVEEDFIEKGKEVPRNFQKLVKDQLKDSAKDFEEEYAQKIKTLLASKDDVVQMRDRNGRLKEVPVDQRNEALKNGYKLVK